MFYLITSINFVLAFIVYQDYKYKGVYWWLFPALFCGLAVWSSEKNGGHITFDQLWQNGLFVLLQVVLLNLYISLKNRRLTNIFKGYFGLGDLLFLLSITVYFPFIEFLIFYVFSLVIVILTSTMFSLLKLTDNNKIPLAGHQALIMLIIMISDTFGLNFLEQITERVQSHVL